MKKIFVIKFMDNVELHRIAQFYAYLIHVFVF